MGKSNINTLNLTHSKAHNYKAIYFLKEKGIDKYIFCYLCPLF